MDSKTTRDKNLPEVQVGLLGHTEEETRRQKQREYWRRYYYKNLERMRKRAREWAARDRGSHAKAAREWNRKNPSRHRENLYRWRDKNRTRLNAISKKYRTSQLGRIAFGAAMVRRRSRLRVNCTLTLTEWNDILVEWNNSCAYCHRTNLKITKDHVIPLTKGGHHTKENVVPACHSCNSRKRTQLITPSKEFPLFRPVLLQ